MFDFIGDYINWVTDDGWTVGGTILLALSAAGALMVIALVIGALVALIGMVSPPYGADRAAAKAEWLESEEQRKTAG